MAIWMLIKRTPPCPLLQPLRHCLSRKKKPAPLWSVSRNPPEAGKSWKIWKGNPWVESSWTPVESLDLPPDFGKHHPVGFTAGHVTFQNSRKFGSHPRAFFFWEKYNESSIGFILILPKYDWYIEDLKPRFSLTSFSKIQQTNTVRRTGYPPKTYPFANSFCLSEALDVESMATIWHGWHWWFDESWGWISKTMCIWNKIL